MKLFSKRTAVFGILGVATATVIALLLPEISGAQPSPVPARAVQDKGEDFAGDEGPDPLANTSVDPGPAPKRAQGRRGNEKDTEGTKAPNRFETDSVIKSRYHLDGEPLEVDPD